MLFVRAETKLNSSELEKLFPNFYEGMKYYIEDLAKERNNKDVLKLLQYFNSIIEIEGDTLKVRIPMLERILNDKEVLLSEYIEDLEPIEIQSLRYLGILEMEF